MELVISKDDFKNYALHLSTMGAFVQQPNPCIVGVSEDEIIMSCDAKSLYPTIMALLNIGFDTLYGRIYDEDIIEPVYNLLSFYYAEKHKPGQTLLRNSIYDQFFNGFKTLLMNYCNKEKPQGIKELTENNLNIYSTLLNRLLDFNGTLDNLFNPKTDYEYFLLKSCFFPMIEFMNWTSSKNKKYSRTVIDRVFHNETDLIINDKAYRTNVYYNEYKSKKFFIFTDINSVKTKFQVLNFEEAEKILSNYLLNPYGTIYFNQHQKKSFSVDIILNDMKGRATVKNKMLILEAIEANWDSLDNDEKNGFVLDNKKVNERIAYSIIQKVGDTDEKRRNWQLEVLCSIDFSFDNSSYKNASDKHSNLKYQMKILIEQYNVKQNGIKTSLNSDYGIYAMVTWEFANFLISNSITTGGKVLGTNLFQQIAKNVLIDEENKFQNIQNILEVNSDIFDNK